ncbi:hypothetical protein NDU88_004912 [Pleurodeles waltl]|uniref:Uncharacterized protein n=1 Tax=Pleurodeles waltl TaxID=8319 RepID=A0AAV7TVM0_PLEWA|nr:hypothetical protein NDU88_004912 [Pleurodeles waltl]
MRLGARLGPREVRPNDVQDGGTGGGGTANPGVGPRGERNTWLGVGKEEDDRSGPGTDWLQCLMTGLLAGAPGGGSEWLWGAHGGGVLPHQPVDCVTMAGDLRGP